MLVRASLLKYNLHNLKRKIQKYIFSCRDYHVDKITFISVDDTIFLSHQFKLLRSHHHYYTARSTQIDAQTTLPALITSPTYHSTAPNPIQQANTPSVNTLSTTGSFPSNLLIITPMAMTHVAAAAPTLRVLGIATNIANSRSTSGMIRAVVELSSGKRSVW